ncbi:unnamed protein product [Ascophyllum nodosum]
MSDRNRRKAFHSIAPRKGERTHISLKGWFGGVVTEIFCSDEGVIAVEPEQSSFGKKIDHLALIVRELAEIRERVDKISPQKNSEAASLNAPSDPDDSFRRRQEGMLDANGNDLSSLKITTTNGRLAPVWSVSTENMQTRDVEASTYSRGGVVKAQALIRGYMSRSKQAARLSLEDI